MGEIELETCSDRSYVFFIFLIIIRELKSFARTIVFFHDYESIDSETSKTKTDKIKHLCSKIDSSKITGTKKVQNADYMA